MEDNKLQSNLGKYASDAFCITLSRDVNVIPDFEENENDDIPFEVFVDNKAKFSIFLHEYWHYLINVSSLARYRDFSLNFHLFALFSKTLTEKENGVSSGNKLLSDSEKKMVKTFLKAKKVYLGSKVPVFKDESIKGRHIQSFSVTDIKSNKENFNLKGKDKEYYSYQLILNVETQFGHKKATFQFGNISIEEGLAHSIESFVYNNDQIPTFPYKVINQIPIHLTGENIPKIDLCIIATLSLLTLNPAQAFIYLVQFYQSDCRELQNSNDRRILLIQQVRNHFEEGAKLVIKELDEIVTLSKKRGAIELAVKYIRQLYQKYFGIRKSHYLFDLAPFLSGKVDIDSLEDNIEEYYPCDLIQKGGNGEDIIGRDQLYTFDHESYDWNKTNKTAPYYLKPFYALQAYVFSHLTKNGFKSSDNAKCKCPFYNICELSDRKNHSELCKNKPWELYEKQDELCWFTQGVSSLLGITEYKTDT